MPDICQIGQGAVRAHRKNVGHDDRETRPSSAIGRLMVDIHDSSYCDGRGSWVDTSQRTLNTGPVYWDEQRSYASRRCEHIARLRDLDTWSGTIRFSGRWVGIPLVVLFRQRRSPSVSLPIRPWLARFR